VTGFDQDWVYKALIAGRFLIEVVCRIKKFGTFVAMGCVKVGRARQSFSASACRPKVCSGFGTTTCTKTKI
jgi:hypothetical protein